MTRREGAENCMSYHGNQRHQRWAHERKRERLNFLAMATAGPRPAAMLQGYFGLVVIVVVQRGGADGSWQKDVKAGAENQLITVTSATKIDT